jgi:hypothetical protein
MITLNINAYLRTLKAVVIATIIKEEIQDIKCNNNNETLARSALPMALMNIPHDVFISESVLRDNLLPPVNFEHFFDHKGEGEETQAPQGSLAFHAYYFFTGL